MSPENFAYWLQGFVELTQGQTPCPAQWKAIKEHLDLVFKKVTPPIGAAKVKVEIDTKEAQKSIDDLKKAYDDLTRRAKEASPFDPAKIWRGDWPQWPTPPNGTETVTLIC